MDIQQTIDARAVLTLGKDMTFRDYAQGAFRMRGIGKGQTIEYVWLLTRMCVCMSMCVCVSMCMSMCVCMCV